MIESRFSPLRVTLTGFYLVHRYSDILRSIRAASASDDRGHQEGWPKTFPGLDNSFMGGDPYCISISID